MNEPAAPIRNETSVAGFEKGVPGVTPPFSREGRKGIFLTDVIVELGLADRSSIDEAEATARTSGKTVEQVLLDANVIDENQLSRALAERNGLDHIELEKFEVDMSAAESVRRSVANRSGAAPIAFSPNGALIVAVQDTFDALAVRRLEATTGKEVRPVIAAVTAINQLIERLPDESAEQASEPVVPRIKSQRDLQVGNPASLDEEPSTQSLAEPDVAAAGGFPMGDRPADSVSEPDPNIAEEANCDEQAEDGLSSFDGLSMDLGPMSMGPGGQDSPTVEIEDRDGSGDPQGDLAHELVKAKKEIAELEEKLEEALAAAEDAVLVNERLRTLRRAIDRKDP